jgi:LacI family transcriptional regulator
VSSSTVARILRGDTRESRQSSAERARQIRQLAREMGYRPNLRARAFSRKRTRGIGLLYTDDAWIFEGVNTQVVISLVRTLQRDGYHLVFAPIDDGAVWEEIVLGGQIDGGVVFQPLRGEVRNAMRDRHLPLVLLGDNSDRSVPHVVVDDVAGAFMATKHLIGFGHQRIMLFIHESVKPHCSIQDRTTGYRAAMAEAGLEPRELVKVSEGEATDVLARGHARPTGVLCYSDLESTLLVQSMWQMGLVVPRDVSLIGFNDVFATRYMTPPLTTVGFDATKIGEWGAQLVLKEIDEPAETKEHTALTVKPTLIVRASTGPLAPPASE